ncbi:MAG: GNAT family N-acetyltransferase [Acidaminococcaceae bacterium]|nr:GNAT family N-acetyltransferase [Acidaminococcaceae bacterium]
MIFRVVNEKRLPKVKELWAQCFEKDGDPFFEYYFSEYCLKNNTVLGGFDEQDNLLTMLHLNPYMLRLRGAEILTPYIVGVATAEKARGKHLMGELLQMAFQILRSQDFPFVFLMPITKEIYEPYGFAFVDFRQEYDLAKIHGNPQYQFEKIEPSQKVLAPLYDVFTKDCNSVLRTDFQWNKLLSVVKVENTQCELIKDNGKDIGYLFIEKDNKVTEYINLHNEATGDVKPFMMARCIDVRVALAKMNVTKCPDCSFIILVGDDFIEENNHLLEVAVQDGKLSYASTDGEEDFAMDIDVFTQLYFGVKDVLDFVEQGEILVKNSLKLAALSRLFPKSKTYINEYF